MIKQRHLHPCVIRLEITEDGEYNYCTDDRASGEKYIKASRITGLEEDNKNLEQMLEDSLDERHRLQCQEATMRDALRDAYHEGYNNAHCHWAESNTKKVCDKAYE